MHELSLSTAIVDTAARHADGRRVSVVNLRVGELRQVVPSTLDFYFGLAARGTPCEGARLLQERVPALVRCAQCGRGWRLETPVFLCRDCGGAAEVVSGDELLVESIEVEA